MTPTKRAQVLVIGGGINGSGIARDLTLRGVRVILVEKSEFGSGTSWSSSGMIHGGLRYLQQDPEVTYHSCVDSGAIQRIAPHLVSGRLLGDVADPHSQRRADLRADPVLKDRSLRADPVLSARIRLGLAVPGHGGEGRRPGPRQGVRTHMIDDASTTSISVWPRR